MEQRPQIEGPGRRRSKQVSLESGQAVIDMAHTGSRVLVVKRDLAILIEDIAAIPAALIPKDCHHSGLSAGLECFPKRPEMDRQKRIAVEYQESIAEHAP